MHIAIREATWKNHAIEIIRYGTKTWNSLILPNSSFILCMLLMPHLMFHRPWREMPAFGFIAPTCWSGVCALNGLAVDFLLQHPPPPDSLLKASTVSRWPRLAPLGGATALGRISNFLHVAAAGLRAHAFSRLQSCGGGAELSWNKYIPFSGVKQPQRASGAMDNASDYGSEDSRFDSWLARSAFLVS